MKRFFIKCLIYIGIILLCSVLFLRVLVSFPNQYCLLSHEVNVVRQIERMQCIEEPKIVIIGGSGCGFGLCSPFISEHFKMPVFNTGTHAGLGLITQLDLYKKFINKGDIVIIIPEYDQYITKMYFGDVSNLRILSSCYPYGYKYFSVEQQFYLIRFVPLAFEDAISSIGKTADDIVNVPYLKSSLNEYGDVESYENRHYLDTRQQAPKVWDNLNPKLQKHAIVALQEYYEYCKGKKATMILLPPAYQAKSFDANKEYINTIWSALEEAQLPLASYPERYRMADTLLYDTEYHLTYEGVILRTSHLIEDLDSAMVVYGNN